MFQRNLVKNCWNSRYWYELMWIQARMVHLFIISSPRINLSGAFSSMYTVQCTQDFKWEIILICIKIKQSVRSPQQRHLMSCNYTWTVCDYLPNFYDCFLKMLYSLLAARSWSLTQRLQTSSSIRKYIFTFILMIKFIEFEYDESIMTSSQAESHQYT